MRPLDERARDFARQAHADQQYGEGLFFDLHLTRVVATLERFGERDSVLLAAGWLHDVLEDTTTSVGALQAEFGEDVTDLVIRLTDETMGTRRERQERTHAKIRGRAAAVRVKLADRIANVEFCIETGSELLDRMYRKEYSRFREQLLRDSEYADMWTHLDQLLDSPPLPVKKSGSANASRSSAP